MVSWKLTCISSRAHCSFSRGRCGSNRKRSFFSHLSKHRSQHAAWLCCASIPSAPLSLRLAPAATAVVEMVVVCKCKCKQNSRNLCFGLPAVDDFAHGGIDSSNRGEFNVYDKKGGFNASLSCLKFVRPQTTNLQGKACLPQCGSVFSLVRPQMLSSLPLRCMPEQSSRTIRTCG